VEQHPKVKQDTQQKIENLMEKINEGQTTPNLITILKTLVLSKFLINNFRN